MDDYENFELNNRIDAAIFESEEEVAKGAKPISAKMARQQLEKTRNKDN